MTPPATPTEHTFKITGGTRSGNGIGPNLFHSFDQFSVGSLDTAKFVNTTPSLETSNILGRVTGHNPSSIFGTIDTTSYPGANFFLMNPAGIVFGPNATLQVDGAVAFTTADYLRLAKTDGAQSGIFHAHSTADSILTSAPVTAFGFVRPDQAAIPGTITVRGSALEVPSGKSLSLVGGNITIESSRLGTLVDPPLPAPGRQILMASVASSGEVLAGTLDRASNIKGQTFNELGTVQILNHSLIDASGDGGGRIRITGGRLVVDDSVISANSTEAVGSGTAHSAGQHESGIDIQMTQDAVITNAAVVETNVEPGAAHESGGVRITANQIVISGGPRIIAIAKTDPDLVPFTGIRSDVAPEGTAAKSGDISLTAVSIQLKELGGIQTITNGGGNAGHIILNASGDIVTNRANIFSVSEDASGHAGNITLSSSQGTVSLTQTTVTSQTTHSSGNAGSISLEAPQGNIVLVQTQVFNAVAIAGGDGKLGGIQIKANNLDLSNGTVILGNNFSSQVPENIRIELNGYLTLTGGSSVQTDTLGPARAANLSVKAGEVFIADRSSLTSGTSRSGNGGAITVAARESVSITDGASISASSIGPGDAGNISIHAGRHFTLHNGSVTTSAKQSSGGDIDIRASDLVSLINGRISTSVLGGTGNGGNIFIDPNMVVLQNNSQIVANAIAGHGGNIAITTPLFLADQSSFVDASSLFGLNGTVTIQSPISNLSGTVGQLTSQPSPVHLLVQNRCVALANGQPSTLIVGGRQTFSTSPGGWASSPTLMAIGTGEPVGVRSEERTIGLPAASENDVLSLRHVTSPSFLVRSFLNDVHTGCRL